MEGRFKCGPALSALPLAPENCLALFSARDALNKTCLRLPCRGPLSSFNPISVPPAGARSYNNTGTGRLYTNPRSRPRRVFLSPPSSFPLVTLQHLSPVPLSSFVLHRERVSLSSLLSLRPTSTPPSLSLLLPSRLADVPVPRTGVGGRVYFLPRPSACFLFHRRPPPRCLLLPRCRSFQLLQRQPNKCLSYSFAAAAAAVDNGPDHSLLSSPLHSANSARVHGKTS